MRDMASSVPGMGGLPSLPLGIEWSGVLFFAPVVLGAVIGGKRAGPLGVFAGGSAGAVAGLVGAFALSPSERRWF